MVPAPARETHQVPGVQVGVLGEGEKDKGMMQQSKPKLRWKRQPDERDLAGICPWGRGYDLCYNDKILACVRPLKLGTFNGYYWHAMAFNAYRNTSTEPVATMEEAKTQAMAWIRANWPDEEFELKQPSRALVAKLKESRT